MYPYRINPGTVLAKQLALRPGTSRSREFLAIRNQRGGIEV
jgi:hypothetical protein